MFADLEFNGARDQKTIARAKYIGLNQWEIWLEGVKTGEVVSQRPH
jgi:hypothetical protein